MSFMPDVGALVRLCDGRYAIVSNVDPAGEDDRVLFNDGHEEKTDAWQIAEVFEDPVLPWRCCARCRQQHLGGWHRTLNGDPCEVDDEAT